MNVNLAVQTVSSSVATALEFLKDDLTLPEFKGCGPSIQFIRQSDRVFDILKSRNPYGKGFKSPLRHSNISLTESIFMETGEYLSLLANETQLLVKSRRKTFVLGFIISMRSIVALSKILLQRDQNPFKYVLPYKLSQDHIGLLFACIRVKGGFNNNPNTLQLKYALRNILMKKSITASNKANVMSCDNESTGSLFSLKWSKHISPIVEAAGDSDNDDAHLQELSDALNRVIISDISENVLFYIAGFIVPKLKRQIDCSICSKALLLKSSPSATSECRETPSHDLFLERRNNGGLIKVSYDVYRIIKYAEQAFRYTVKGNGEINKASNL